MKTWRYVILLLAALSVNLLARADEPATPAKIRVLLTYGGHGFEEGPFFAMFDALPNIQVTRAPLPQSADWLKPGLKKECDVLVMYDMIPKITPKQQENFIALLKRGIGVVALHHNLGAHPDWPEFRKIIGGKFFIKPTEINGKRYNNSGWDHDQDLRITIADKEHPITCGLKDFTIHDEVYNHYLVEPGVKILLTTDHPKNDPQIAWVKEYGKSRVFYLMLGHDPQAWKHENYPILLERGIRWASGR
jgi:type 1 glutamine amidotransferase